MNCLDCQDWLQRRLDGEPMAGTPDVEQHLGQCAACREQHGGALRMVAALQQQPRPMSPADFAERIVGAVLLDRRRRLQKMRRGLLVTMALAASVLVMVVAAYWWTPPDRPAPRQQFVLKVEPKKIEAAPATRAEPRNALDRMANATREHAKVVLVAANLDGVEKLPVNDLPALDPGLREAGQEVSDGVRAVTRNTFKAFDFFARELPMPEVKN